MTMSREVERILPLLERDVVATVGHRYRRLVQEAAANVRTLDTTDNGQKLVDDVQQYIHDTFVDTTWPACPRHSRHPLWYRDGAWWCEQDGTVMAQLGDLERQGQ